MRISEKFRNEVNQIALLEPHESITITFITIRIFKDLKQNGGQS